MKTAQQKSTVNLYAVAKITGCFGIKGYVKVLPLTHSPERLNDLTTVRLGKTDEQTSEHEIERINFQTRSIHMKMKGIDDRTQAEFLVGNYLFVSEDELAPPPKGSWFIHEIIGCSVFLEDGTPMGVVNDVWQMPGNDLWEIDYHGKPVMVPTAKEFIRKVDIAKKRIVIAPPEGLFEI